MIVYWEMTQACALACKHCRAEAMPSPHPLELTSADGKALVRQILDFGNPLPHLILTGGDPLSRKDLYDLIDYARSCGLEVSITPSATPALTGDALDKLKRHGIQSLGLSLDGSRPDRHDAIRAVSGCFDRTIAALCYACELGLPIQINTLVSEETAADLPAIYRLLQEFPIMRWSLFFRKRPIVTVWTNA
jgi:AdoMet-dependent heme synthase